MVGRQGRDFVYRALYWFASGKYLAGSVCVLSKCCKAELLYCAVI